MSPNRTSDPTGRYDVTIVGGGPAGLAAALLLGRARKRVLLVDTGTPRNARAHEVHGFVTRDGIPPAEFRRIAHEQLLPYPSVSRSEDWVEGVTGERDDFRVQFRNGADVQTRRVLLALGMVDVLPDLPGYGELWGHSLFQCPYCHGWEVQDQRFGFLAPDLEKIEFGRFLKGWSSDVIVLTDGRFEVPAATRAKLAAAGVPIDERPIRQLIARSGEDALEAVEFTDGNRLERDVLFVRPPQRQVALVDALGLDLDPLGFVRIDGRLETSRPGVFAAGDMATPMQAAMAAAATGFQAAAMINHDLMVGAPMPTKAS